MSRVCRSAEAVLNASDIPRAFSALASTELPRLLATAINTTLEAKPCAALETQVQPAADLRV